MLAALATALAAVAAHGAEPATAADPHLELVLEPLTVAGDHRAEWVEERSAVAVIELEGDYDLTLPDGSSNLVPRTLVAREFLAHNPDDFDFLVVFSTFEFEAGPAQAFAWVVRNDVQGIGLPLFDNSDQFGSAGRLQTYVDMAALGGYATDPLSPEFERTLTVLAHELLHRWGSRVRFERPDGSLSDDLLGQDGSHWSFLLDTGGSLHYGNDWHDNGDGTFTSIAALDLFSPLDLYLAGFYAPHEVPPMTLIEAPGIDPTRLPETGVTIAGTASAVTVADIIAAEGPRLPPAGEAQRDFRAAFVVVRRAGETISAEQILGIDRIRRELLARFSVLTGGRGLLQVFPQAVVETPGAPGGVGGGDPRPGAANVLDALAWLRGRQSPEGWWEDRPSTRVRDTAEALVTLISLDPLFTGAGPAAAWLAAQPETTVDSLARAASALARVGADASQPAARLAALQNADGGWGVAAGYASDPLDTALAVAALVAAGGPQTAVDAGVAYLAAVRHPAGGWSSLSGGPGRTGVTGTALGALAAAGQGGGPADPGVGWLAGKQNPDGGFGDSPSTVHDTAGTLETLMAIEAVGEIDGGAAAAYLDSRQTVDGSWAGSVYSTALAATALKRFNFPNWAFAGAPSAEPEAPRDGQRVTLRFTVVNDGNALAPAGVLRLYEGEPGSGTTGTGTAVADVALPPLAPAQQAVVTLLWDSLDRAGTRTLTAVADPDGAVAELSETDNLQSLTLEVLPAAAGPDLELREPDLLVTPAQPTELPAELTVGATVRNLGLTDATGVVVRLLVGEEGAETTVGEVTIDVPARSSALAGFAYTLETAGITRLTVVADPDGVIAEDDEGNNAASRTVATGATVDLEITASDLELMGTPYLGTDVAFRVTVRNRGTLDSPTAELRLTVSDGVTVREVALTSVQLAGGASATFEIPWRVDLEGDLELTAEVDPGALVPETDEGNNLARLAFTAGALDVANLEVSFQDLVFAPDPGEEGRPLTLSILVRNTGGQPVSGVEVAFYDGDPAAGGVQIEDRAVIASLAPGEEATATVVWPRVPTAADRLIFAVADPDDAIEEFREDDNAAFQTLVVLGLPDPAVSPASLALEPALPQPGLPATLTVTVSNLGQQPVSGLVVRAFDGDPDLGGLPLGDQVIGALAGDGSAIAAFTWSPAGGDRRPVVVLLDPDGAVEEASEANNRAEIDLVVQDGDFVVSERWFSPDGDGVRDDTTLLFRLDAPTGAPTDVEVQVIDAERDLMVRRAAFPGTVGDEFTWDGRDELGRLGRDADYLLRLVDDGGATLGEAPVTLDTNRLSLLRVAGTPFHAVTNLTCELPTTSVLVGTDDESWFYFMIQDTGDPLYPRGIYRVRPDGSELTQILTASFFGTRTPRDLVVSRDGSLIAFRATQSCCPFNADLYVANGDGSGPLELGDPAVSSPDEPFGLIGDGEALLVRRDSRDWVRLPLDGFTPESVLYTGLADTRHAVLSSDHRRLAFRERLDGTIRLLDLDTGASRLLIQEPGFPDAAWTWSPDGERLAITDHLGERLAVFDREGDEIFSLPLPSDPHPLADEFEVLDPQELETGRGHAPTWSRSATELALAVSYGAPGEICEDGVEYNRYLAVDLLTGAVETIGWSEVRDYSFCESYHVATWDGTAWVEHRALHYGPRLSEQRLDLSRLLPDADGAYRLRIRQTGRDLAEVGDVSLLAGGFRLPPASAAVVDGGDALAAVTRRDGTAADLHEKTLELSWEPPGSPTLVLALTAREETLGDPTAAGAALSDPAPGVASHSAAQEAEGGTGAGEELLPYVTGLLWDPNDRALLFGRTAVFLDEGSRQAPMLETWQTFSGAVFTPSGRRLVFASSDRTNDPESACYQRGFSDTFVLRSLLNLTADLRARRSAASSGVLVEGTAADLNFDRWQLDWARQGAPEAWSPVAPPETAPVIDGRFTTWVPPEPGSFLVRLTAEDRAGNRRSAVQRVFSPDTPSITDLYLSPRLFSPDGDGVLDRARVHYRVLQPVHLEFRFLDADGTPVRTIARDHATIGTDHEIEWDGRDDAGLPVPDGDYRMTVQSYELFVTVDTTPPQVELTLSAVETCVGGGRAARPVLGASLVEPHLESFSTEWGAGADPLTWQHQPFTLRQSESSPERYDGQRALSLGELTGRRFRMHAADLAGNRALVTTPLAAEELVLTGFGRHRVAADGGLAPLGAVPCGFGTLLLEHGPVRLATAESVVRELVQATVEFQPVPVVGGVPRPDLLDEAGWFATPVDPFPPAGAIPERGFEVLWDLAGVGVGVHTAVRLATLDLDATIHRAAPLAIQTDGVQFHGILRLDVLDPQSPARPVLTALLAEADLATGEDLVLWGSEFVAEPLAAVTLLISSDDDPRYAAPVPVPAAALAEGYFIFHDPELRACTRYSGYVVAETEPRLDPATGQFVSRTVTSGIIGFDIPCLSLGLFRDPLRVDACEAPRLSSERGFTLRPRSLDGRPLQLLTLSGPDPSGAETVLFSVNAPASEADYRYVFDLAALPEGRYPLSARLTNVDGELATVPGELVVDNTPPELAITYPAEGQRVCGVPSGGSNVLTIEGTLDDDAGFSYSLAAGPVGGSAVGIGGGLSVDPSGLVLRCGETGCAPGLSGTRSLHGPLGGLADVEGTIEAHLEVVDEGGFRRCADRSFDFDGLLEDPFASVDLEVFSPNGDGVADSAAITFGAGEPGTVRVEMYPAVPFFGGDGLPCAATGSRLRTVAADLPYLDLGQVVWDGRDDGGAVVPDGVYKGFVGFEDGCGNQAQVALCTEVDTTPPALAIDFPTPTSPLPLIVEVFGSVHDPHLEGWALEYGVGSDPETWARIGGGLTNLDPQILAAWNTFGLAGEHTLRLVGLDRVGNRGELGVPLVLSTPLEVIAALEALPRPFSPNGDGRRDALTVRFGLAVAAVVDLTIYDEADQVVRSVLSGAQRGAGEWTATWDGATDAGQPAADGGYRAELFARLAADPAVTQRESVTAVLDRTAPAISVASPLDGAYLPSQGPIQGTIEDLLLAHYAVSQTDTPDTPLWIEIDRGSTNRVDHVFGSLDPLAEGEWALRFEATDQGESESETVVRFTLDDTPPEVTLAEPATGSVLSPAVPVEVVGTVEEEHLDLWRLEVGAGAEPASWTELASGGELPVPEPAATWSLSALADGLYTVRLSARDLAGHETAVAAAVTVDGTAPALDLTVPAAGGYVSGPTLLAGTAADPHLVEYTVAVAPGPPGASTQFSPLGSGTSSVTGGPLLEWLNLPADGLYTLRLAATDRAANAAELLRQVTVDTQPPAAPQGLTATAENGRDGRLAWQPNGEPDLAGYHVYRDGARITTAPVVPPTYLDPQLAEGPYRYTVTAVDDAGQESLPATPADLRIDLTPPLSSLTRPAAGSRVGGLVEVIGTAFSLDDFQEYRLWVGPGDGSSGRQLLRRSPVPIEADRLGEWSTAGLAEGSAHTLILEAEDLAGNVGEAQAAVLVDNQPPAPPTGLAAAVAGADVQLTWNASPEPDLAGYLLYRDGRLANAEGPVVGPLDPYLLSSPAYGDLARPDGTFTYEVYARDTAGNLSDPSAPAQVTLDNRAPRATIVHPEDGTRFDESLYLLATSEDTDVAEVRFDVRAVGDPTWMPIAAADIAEPWEVDWTPTGSFGDYELRAVATDEGGRSDAEPPTIVVTYTDITPPAAPTGLTAAVDGGDVTLSWDPVAEADLAGYHVDRSADGGDPVRITAAPLTATAHVDTGVADGDYAYTVRAVDATDNESAPSEPAAVRVFTPALDQPYTPTAAAAAELTGRGEPAAAAELTVDPAGTTASAVADAEGAFVFPAVALGGGDNTLSVRQTYGAGHRSKPASVSVLSDPPPSAPTGLTAVAGAGLSVDLAWSANPEPDVVAYRLFRDGEPVPDPEPVPGLAATATSQDNFNPASRAVDGDPDTYWRPSFASGTIGESIEVSSTPARHLIGLDVTWRDFFGVATSNPGDYDLEAWDGRAWVPLVRVRGDTGVERHFDLALPYRTDRVRLVLRAAPTSPYLAELTPIHAPLIAGTAHSDLTDDGRHEYRLLAVDEHGLEGPLSDPVAVDVGDVEPPEPPVLSTSVAGSDVTLTWTASAAPDVARYDLYRDGSKFAEHGDLGSLTSVDAGRPNGTWLYTVRAVDQVGNVGDPSNESAAVVAVAPPPAPVALSVTAPPVGGALDLAWQPGAGPAPAGYRVLRATVAGGPHSAVITVAGTTYRDSGLTDGVTYWYVVRAVDAPGNEGPDSNEASGVPGDLEAPAAPVLHFPGFADASAALPATTSAAAVRVVGSAEPGAAVTLSRDGDPAGQATAAAADETVPYPLSAPGVGRLSPDGRFVWFDDGPQSLLLDLVSGVSAPVAVGAETRILWLPDSSGVIFGDGDDEIVSYRLADGSVSTVVDGVAAVAVTPGPDGRLVVAGFRDGVDGIWLVDPASDTWTRIGTDPWWYFNTGSLTWSPDGGAIAYLRQSPQRTVEILDLATLATTVVATDPGSWPPDWSPGGLRLVYQTGDSPARTALYTLASGATELLPASADDQYVARWWPDGTAVVFAALADGVYLHDLVTGASRRLFDLAGVFDLQLDVAAAGRLLAVIEDVPHRFTPAGRFELAGLPLDPGDNSFTAVAADAVGNSGPASAPMVVRRASTGLPDLSVSAGELAVLPAAPLAGSTAQVSAVVRNLGSVASPPADLTLRVLGPGGWAATLAEGAVLGPLAPGGAQTVSRSVTLAGGAGAYTLVAAADPLDRLAEASEADNRAERAFTAPADGVVSVTAATDLTEYANDQPVAITVQVFNFGDPFTGDLTVTVEDAAGFPVTTVLTVPGIALDYAESAVFTPAWNTGSTFAGVYRVAARLVDAAGAPAAEALAPFTLSDFALLAARVETDRAGYPAGATVRLSGTLDYLAGNGPLSGTTATLAVYDAADALVAEWPRPLGDLLPGSSGTVTADWESSGAPAGAYRVAFTVARGGETLAQAATVFDLTAGAVPVSGSLALSDRTPAVGVPLQAVLTVVNDGAAALPATPLRVRLHEPAGGTVVAEAEAVHDLDPGAPVSASLVFATAPLGIGNFVAVLSAELPASGGGTVEITLDAVGFSTADGTPPAVTVVLPEPGSVVGADPPLEAVALDALSPVRRVEARIDSGAWSPLPPIDPASGLWGQALTGLTAGAHQVEVRAFDTWDNVGVAGPVAFTVAPPELAAAKSWSLAADLDGDGLPSPGDRLGYAIAVVHSGGAEATDVTLTDPIPEHTAVVPGSVQASQGQVVSEDPVAVNLGTIAAGASATVSFQVAIADPFPTAVLGVVNQGSVAAEGVDPVATDDPATAAAGDPTATDVFIVPALTVADVTALESAGEAVLAVDLSEPSNRPLTVAYATAAETAAEGVDYAAAAGTLTVAAGEAAATVAVPLFDDPLDEPDESFLLLLSAPSGATLADADGRVTIADDDEPPAVSIADLTVAEGDEDTAEALFTVSLSGASGREVRVDVATADDTATAPDDYLEASETLTFAPGETERSFAVEVVGDLLLEADPETFSVTLSSPVDATLGDAEAVGAIADDELCPSPNLLLNPGAEAAEPAAGGLAGWVEVEGSEWQRRPAPPDPAEGEHSFFAGAVELGELAQGVDVTAYQVPIDAAAGQRFAFSGQVQTFDETPPDTARIVVEYRNADNDLVLEAFDSGELTSPLEWLEVSDTRTAPAGTRWIRVVLISTRFAPLDSDAYFDDLALVSLRTPVLSLDDGSLPEGDAGIAPVALTARLSCPVDAEVTALWATADGTAVADQDYLPLADQTLTLAAGETTAEIAVPVIGDTAVEGDETFGVVLSEPAGAVVLDPLAVATIVDDDGVGAACPDPATIDYRGYTAADCAVPQNAVTVFDQAELDGYLADFGFDGSKVRNVIVKFNPEGDVDIVSPCEIRLSGEGTGGFLDIEADRVCLYGRRGVTVAEDQGNPDQGIVAGAILLVSEEGSAGFSKGLALIADSIAVQAHKEAKVGLDCEVAAGTLSLVSTGDLPTSDALVRQGSTVTADEVLIEASRGATLGPSTVFEVAGALTLRSTGSVSGSVAKVSQAAEVSAESMALTSGNKVVVGQQVTIDVTGHLEADAAGVCTISGSATIVAGSTSGSCLP